VVAGAGTANRRYVGGRLQPALQAWHGAGGQTTTDDAGRDHQGWESMPEMRSQSQSPYSSPPLVIPSPTLILSSLSLISIGPQAACAPGPQAQPGHGVGGAARSRCAARPNPASGGSAWPRRAARPGPGERRRGQAPASGSSAWPLRALRPGPGERAAAGVARPWLILCLSLIL